MDTLKTNKVHHGQQKDKMNNQKDTQKTSVNIYGQSNVLDGKSLSDNPSYEFANKKTEKLVTALYMVTDCMDTDDALKGKLRLLGVELLSDMYKFSILSPVDKRDFIHTPLAHINEILSFVEIAYTVGFISEMNTLILKKEFGLLISELESHKMKDKHFTFTLDQNMFELPELSVRQGLTHIKDMPAHADKRTSYNNLSFINNNSPLSNFQDKRTRISRDILAEKQDRINKIISLIKDMSRDKAGKKDIPENRDGVSIKDISQAITDCSEKTIQRELNTLVLKGELKKTGAKRWSRYSVI